MRRGRRKYICQCCGEKVFRRKPEKYEICPVCGWEKDPVQEADPDFAGGANKMSLNEARAAYKVKEQTNEE